MQEEKSGVLFLTICSNRKTEGGEPEYSEAGSISQHLSPAPAKSLYKARRGMLDLIAKHEYSRDGSRLLRDLPYNDQLGDGPDFQMAGKRPQGGCYLPAIRRYKGRYYTALDREDERVDLMDRTPHHVLIISGLYGLLTPQEQIQCYSLHVADHNAIPNRWRKHEILTKAIVDYIERYDIKRVFDFTGDEMYRKLVAWDMLAEEVSGNILHAFSLQQGGPDMLPDLGELTRYLLDQPQDVLLGIQPEDEAIQRKYKIVLKRTTLPEGVARQIYPAPGVVRADEINRMRREITTILKMVGPKNWGEGFLAHAKRLPIPPKIKQSLTTFARMRNNVDYDEGILFDREWNTVIDIYTEVIDWARQEGYTSKIVDKAKLRQIKLEGDEE